MELIENSPNVFVHHNDVTFAAYVINDTTLTVSQIEVMAHPGAEIKVSKISNIEKVPNISLFMIMSLVYEAKLDPQIGGNKHNLDNLDSSYRVFLYHLSRNSFIAKGHKDKWGDYIDPFLYELADAILRKTSTFSSIFYNLGFNIEWKQEKIVKLTWFPLF